MKFYKFLTAISAIALAVGFSACSDDDDIVYDYDGTTDQIVITTTSDASYKVVKTPVSVVGATIDWTATARARARTTEPITVKYTIDNSKVADYNAATGEDAVAAPDGAVTLVNDQVSFAVGENLATDSVSAVMTENETILAQFQIGTTYVVPITLSSVVKGDCRIGSVAEDTSYLVFTVTEELINYDGTPTGTLVDDRSGWSISHTGATGTITGWLSGSWAYARATSSFEVNVDLGKTYSFDGIYAPCMYYGYYDYTNYYGIFKATNVVQYSVDGSNWSDIGEINTTVNTNLCLYAPISARYIKITINALYSPYSSYRYAGCSNFNIYVK